MSFPPLLLSAQVLSLRCSSRRPRARCRSPSPRCSYTQYGKISTLQVKLPIFSLFLCATSMLMPATKALWWRNGRVGGFGHSPPCPCPRPAHALPCPALPTGVVWSPVEKRWPLDKDNSETLHAHQKRGVGGWRKESWLALWQTCLVVCERGLSKRS